MLQSIGEIPVIAAQQFGDRRALTIDGQSFTFRQIDQLSNQFANALERLGIKSGDRVTLYGANSWQWIVSYYGALKTGAVINPINVMLTPPEVEFVVRDCGASFLLASAATAQTVAGVKTTSAVREVITFGDDPPAGTLSLAAILSASSNEYNMPTIDRSSLSTIAYTSGTTGHPKGACLSHHSVLLNVAMTSLMHARSDQDVVVTSLPCAHVYGNVVMNSAVQKGMHLCLHSRFDEKVVLQSIQEQGATLFEGVPTMYMQLLNHPSMENSDLSTLRCCTVGGQTMPVPKMKAVEARFACPLIELWGMTELAGLGTTFAVDGPVKHGSIGVALPYVQTRIAATDDASQTLPAGEVGELMVKGGIVMQGYYNNESATRETIEPDGWLHTGDLASMDDDGCVFIVDRKKDMILTAGYNIYPAELERVIAGHPDVAMVAVGSVPDEEKGELAKAYIVLKNHAAPDADSILAYCRKQLSAYKVPRAIQFVDDLPKTSTGKVMRRALKSLD